MIIEEILKTFKEKRKKTALKMSEFGVFNFFSDLGYQLNLHNVFPSAPLSPYYINFRNAVRIPDIRKELASMLQPFVENFAPKRLVDLPESITPLITTISDNTNIPIISVRSEYLKSVKKTYGLDFPINGDYNKREYVLIIDDVCSAMASTKFKAIQILKDAGLEPYYVIMVLLDREEGGKEKLKEAGIDLWSLYTLNEFVQYLREENQINQETCDKVIRYSQEIKKFVLGG